MRRIARTLGTLAAVSVLTCSLPLVSRAASGVFTYNRFDGTKDVQKRISDPKEGTCVTVFRSRVPVENNTDAEAQLWSKDSCQGDPVEAVPPMGKFNEKGSEYEFRSVYFRYP
ncbi:hypothetical protein [Streptomyces sp. NPDC046261]|uniref:hypothetical protein n=1 Tax=Streptomyces sp. NPDC046261 TaxID=3157200 RepID=UPI0033D57916